MKIKFKRPPIYGKKTLRLAVEFGMVMSEVANDMKIKITPQMSVRAEEILINELKTNGLEKTAVNFVPLILAAIEI